MSISSITTILERATVAAPDSPLAVFRTANGLDCVFFNTVRTRGTVAKNPPNLVAVVDRRTTRQELIDAVGRFHNAGC